jgi:two-component system, cell cycle response regulator DivK
MTPHGIETLPQEIEMHAHCILIVDDDADVRAVVRRTLTALHYDVVEADNGLAGLALAHRHRPALILLDLGLPGIDGWTVARLLRADPALATTPILAMTGVAAPTVLNSALRIGCQQMLSKPFTLATLEQSIASLLAPAAAHA